MTSTAKSALVLAAVGILALVLASTDAFSPASGPSSTTVPATTAPPATDPARTTTTTTIDVEALVPAYLRDLDDDVLVAPLARPDLPTCTEPALSSSVASIIVTSSDPDQRRIIIRVTNESTVTCALGVHLELAFTTPNDGDDTRLAVRRVNPPPGLRTPFSYRDPALEPGKSARFSVVAAAVDFIGAGAAVTSVEIAGRSGPLTQVALPGMRVTAATEWHGPSSGSGTPLDPSSFLVPLPPDGVPTCDPATTRAEVQPAEDPNTTGEVPLVVTNDGTEACALPADLVMRRTGIDAREIPRSEPTFGTYVAPVIPDGGRIVLMLVGEGSEGGEMALRFPNGEEIVTAGDPSPRPPVAWYGPIGSSAGTLEE